MNSRQSRKFVMYLAVRDFLAGSEATWSGLPAFATNVARFRDLLAEIDAKAQESEKTSAGATAEKQRRRQIMAEKTVLVGSLIRAAALVQQDAELEEDAAITASDILRTRDAAAAVRPRAILALGRQRLGSLGDYGVTAEMLDSLATAITNWEESVSRPRTIISGGSVLTAELALLFDQTDDVIEILDRLSVFFKATEPNWTMSWEAARVIVDAGSGSTQPSPALVSRL